MTIYQTSKSKLLETIDAVLAMDIKQKKLFCDTPYPAPYKSHCVPRLLVLISGEQTARFSKDGKITHATISGPLLHFCARDSLLHKYINGTPYRALSFSYYPGYIRAMEINCDGITAPPTADDIFFHSTEPLCKEGFQLIELISRLYNCNQIEAAEDLLVPLLRLTIDTLSKSEQSPAKKVGVIWGTLCMALRNHCHEQCNRSDLAAWLRITPGYVSILCKKHSGKSFSELKLSFQFEHAEKLLLSSNLNIEEIALSCGFSSSNYFIRQFKSTYGVTPGEYRKNNNTAV